MEWKTRLEMYNDETIVNSSGLALKYDVMPAPITTDEEVWEGYIKMYTKGYDEETVERWRTYFASCMQPIPFGWTSIAGYWNYCDEYFNNIGIHTLVDNGTAKAADYALEGTMKANYYHAQAISITLDRTGTISFPQMILRSMNRWYRITSNG